MAFIEGTAGNDLLVGTADYDFIFGYEGDDTIDAGMGNASITAGPGSDTVDYSNVEYGFANLYHWDLSAGIDAVLNIDGDIASVTSGSDIDTIIGIQSLFTNPDATDGIFVDGTQYNDAFHITHTVYSDGQLIIRPGDGVDSYYVYGSPGQISNTRLVFFGGNQGVEIDLSLNQGQIINDGYGNLETIYGPANIRQFWLTAHDDYFVGSDADERIIGYSGDDYIDGGNGIDRIDFQGSGFSSVVVNLEEGWATGEYSYFDPIIEREITRDFNYTLANIENVSGAPSSGDDITGSAASNILRGRGGDDTIAGLGGDDTLRGDQGDDYLNGGEGADVLLGGADNDTLNGGLGNDTLNGGSGADCFEFGLQNGQDVVEDFEKGTDKIDLSAFGEFLLFGGRKVVALDLPDHVTAKQQETTKVQTGFDILDSNLDGKLDNNDDAIDVINNGEDMLIDLGAAYGGSAGTDTILLSGIVELTIDDFIF